MDNIHRMQTKLRKITSDRKKEGGVLGVKSVKELEYEETLEAQRHALRELRARTQHLEVNKKGISYVFYWKLQYFRNSPSENCLLLAGISFLIHE